MNSINNYINQMNRNGGVSSFGSVEDLIKTSLGGSFITEQKKEETHPIKEETIKEESNIPSPKEVDELINSSIKRLNNFDPSTFKKKSSDNSLLENEGFERPILGGPESSHTVHDRTFRNEIQDDEPQEIRIPKKQETVSSKLNNYYPFYRDIEEVFECKVTIEGTAANSVVRLLLETETWDVIFQGKIKKDGICSIPIKKLSLFPVGTIGKATLEVIVDDILFTPWENPFRIEESKKVEVEVFKRRPK